MPDILLPPCMPLMPFKLLPQCWSSEGVSLSKSMCGIFMRNCLGLQKFLLLTQSLLIFAARRYGDLSSWHWNPGLGGPGVGLGLLCSRDIHPKFFFTIHVCGTIPFPVSTPPTSLDGCSFFNSVVVGLPFNLISDGSK